MSFQVKKAWLQICSTRAPRDFDIVTKFNHLDIPANATPLSIACEAEGISFKAALNVSFAWRQLSLF